MENLNAGWGSSPQPEVIGRTREVKYPSFDPPAKNAEEALPAAKREGSHLLHRVSVADTLVGLSIMYGVSVPAIKAANNLSTNDIWMKAELVIPREKLPPNFKPHSDEIKKAAAASHLSIALQRVGECKDSQHAQACVEIANGDFREALALMKTVNAAALNLNVDVEDVIVYIRMFDCDVPRGLQELRQDLEWERQHAQTTQQGQGGTQMANRPPGVGARTPLFAFGVKKDQ